MTSDPRQQAVVALLVALLAGVAPAVAIGGVIMHGC